MKNLYLFAIILLFLLSSCEKENTPTSVPKPITLDAEHDCYWFYNLQGEIQDLNSYEYMECGFELSTTPSFHRDSTRLIYVIFNKRRPDQSQESITARIPAEHGSTYYFRTYLFTNNDGIVTGETKSFTADWHVPDLKAVSYKYEKDGQLTFTGTIEGLAVMMNDTLLKQNDYEFGIELSMDESFDDVYFTPVDKSAFSHTVQNDTFRVDAPLFISGKKTYYRTSFRVQPNKINMGESFHSDAKDFSINWQPSYVDLGLSVKWATTNIGGYTPYDHGDYYSWGLTETNYNINQESITALSDWYFNKKISAWKPEYPHGYDESYYNDNYTIYTDNGTSLKPSCDAAYTLWGSEWRIPSNSEFVELISNCTWTPDSLAGIPGYQITSNIPGFEGNSIFLPISEAFISGNIQEQFHGHYWTSNIGLTDPLMSKSVFFNQSYTHNGFLTLSYFGLTIRPVTQ